MLTAPSADHRHGPQQANGIRPFSTLVAIRQGLFVFTLFSWRDKVLKKRLGTITLAWLAAMLALVYSTGGAFAAPAASPYSDAAVKALTWIGTQQAADGSFAGFGAGSTVDAVLAIVAASGTRRQCERWIKRAVVPGSQRGHNSRHRRRCGQTTHGRGGSWTER